MSEKKQYKVVLKAQVEVECDEDYEINIDLYTDYGTYGDTFDCSTICSTRTFDFDAHGETVIEAENYDDAVEKADEIRKQFENALRDGDLYVSYGGYQISTCEITNIDVEYEITEIIDEESD